jgi:hypothetical protein
MLNIQLVTAQKTVPDFEIKAGDFIANANFLIQASTGELITGTDLKIMAIDPIRKAVLWENKDFLGLNEDDISAIDGTPFIKIERQKTLSVSNNKNTFIIQANNGNIVYDSKGEGIKVRNTKIIPQLGGLLMEIVKDGFLSAAFIDFATAKEVWTVPLTKEKSGGIGIGAMKRALKSYTSSAFNVPPLVDANGTLILVYKKEIFAISKSGSLAWKKEFEENVDDAYISSDKNALFIGYKKYIDKLSTADGKSSLKEPVKMRDELNGLLPISNGYIVYNEAGINIMDADGNMKWGKDTKLGNIGQVRYTADGILAIQAVKDDETVFFWVDNNGKKIWDQQISGGFILAEPTAKGVMYVTTERANTLSFEKGKDLWNRDIKLKGVPNFGVDASNKILYAYAKEKLHAFNFNDNTYKLVAENLELKKFNDEEEPLKFDVRNNGATLIINSNQNVLSVQTADGKVNYNNYFKDIGNTKKKFLNVAGTAASIGGAAMEINGMKNFATGTGQFLTKGTSEMEKGINQANAGNTINAAGNFLLEQASKRYLASQATKDNLYILSEMPEGNGLMVWNKDKGEATKKIYFSDTTPVFVVDEATDNVYIMIGNTLKVYHLK